MNDNDNDEIVVNDLMIIPDHAKKRSFVEIVKNFASKVSPQRSPQRSRANSIGNSQEDLNAPPTMQRREEIRNQLLIDLEDFGLISPPSSHSTTTHKKNYKRTEIIPN